MMNMLDIMLFLLATTILCLVVATAPGTPDRAVVWKIIVGALVASTVIAFAGQ
jgi:hypothetical protein